MTADTQRSKVYRAEDVLNGKGRKFTSIEEMQAYVDHACGLVFVKTNWTRAHRGIKVVQGRAGTRAYATGFNTISMPTWAWTEDTLLHEMAHHFAGLSAHHDYRFAGTVLKLVKHFMGKEHHDALRASYKKHGVRYTQPVKLNLSDEQRDEFRVSITKAAAAREAQRTPCNLRIAYIPSGNTFRYAIKAVRTSRGSVHYFAQPTDGLTPKVWQFANIAAKAAKLLDGDYHWQVVSLTGEVLIDRPATKEEK